MKLRFPAWLCGLLGHEMGRLFFDPEFFGRGGRYVCGGVCLCGQRGSWPSVSEIIRKASEGGK